MLVRFTKDVLAVDDGAIYPVQFHAGDEKEIGASLAEVLLRDGSVEHKAIQAAPENKAHTAAPSNKKKRGFW